MNEKNQIIKQKLLNYLIGLNAFWSFDKQSITLDNLSDNLFIEKALIFADVNQLIDLFSIFPKKQILSIWQKKILSDDRYYKLNCYLGTFFFGIKNIEKYIENNKKQFSRYEKLKQLTESN